MHFVVFGCSSGFGLSITKRLLSEGHSVSGVSRTLPTKLVPGSEAPARAKPVFTHYKTDVLDSTQLQNTLRGLASYNNIDGLVLNAGGPPTGNAAELSLDDFTKAGKLVLEWKIETVLQLLPGMRENSSGSILFIESQSMKQPIPGLALSNTYSAAVTGFAKTLAGEVASEGITINVLAPGSHNTPALERIIKRKQETEGISRDEAVRRMTASVPAGRFGEADELAALACWLLSGESRFITGQTISHDGGNIKHLFG